MRKRTKAINPVTGFSLVELMIATTLFIVFCGAFTVFFQMASKSTTTHSAALATDLKIQAVSEAIRYEAATNFDFMTETNKDRSGGDQRLKIASTISQLDTAMQTRQVTVTATWTEDNVVRTKTSTFTIRRSNAKVPGAQVQVHVITYIHHYPVQGAYISAQGQDVPTVTGVTGADGTCTLNGVRVQPTGVMVTVDGESIRYYFDNTPPSFKAQFPSAATVANQLTVLPDIEIKPPVNITGTVINGADGSPAEGCRVICLSNAPIIPSTTQDVTVTSSSGTYSFTVIPGKYGVYMEGSSNYSGLATLKENVQTFVGGGWYGTPIFDTDPNNIYDVDPSHVGSGLTINFSTRRLSNVDAVVQGVSFDKATQKWKTSSTASGFNLRIDADRTTVSDPSIESWQSVWWKRAMDYWKDPDTNGLPPVTIRGTTDGSGHVLMNKVGPGIMLSDVNPDTQGMHYYPRPDYMVDGSIPGFFEFTGAPAPYLPVMVYLDTSSIASAWTLHLSVGWGFSMVPFVRGWNADFFSSDMYQSNNVHPGQTAQTTPIYLMDRSALGSVAFNFVFDADGSPFNGFGWTTQVGNTWGHFATDSHNYAYCGSPGMPGGFFSDLSGYGATSYFATNVMPSISTFPNATPWNFNYFSGWIWGSTNTTAGIDARRNTMWNGAITQVHLFDFNLPNVAVSAYNYPATYQWTLSADIVNGQWTSPNYAAQYAQSWSGAATPQVVPGATTSQEIRFKPYNMYNKPSVYAAPSTNDWLFYPSSAIPNAYSSFSSTYTAMWYLYANYRQVAVHIGTFPQIYGRVLDTNGNPILGATIKVWRSGAQPTYYGTVPPSAAPYEDLFQTTTADACATQGIGCSGGPYQYMLKNVRFVEHPGTNLTVTVTAPGYSSYSQSVGAIDGTEFHQDFILQRQFAAPSTGDL